MVYGLDVHKEFIPVCVVDAQGSKRKEYRIGATAEGIETWARRLGRRDQVVLEATFHPWAIHDIVSRYAGRVAVAHPLEVKAIAHAKIKTDQVDAYTLARLLQANFLPEVVLPDEGAWALRQLVTHRRLLVKQRVANEASLSTNQLVDALHRNPEMLREGHLGLAQRYEELLAEDLSGMSGNTMVGLHGYPRRSPTDMVLSGAVGANPQRPERRAPAPGRYHGPQRHRPRCQLQRLP